MDEWSVTDTEPPDSSRQPVWVEHAFSGRMNEWQMNWNQVHSQQKNIHTSRRKIKDAIKIPGSEDMDRRRGVTSDEAINRRYPVWVEHAFRGTINEWKVHWDKIRARWNPFAGLPADQSEENGSVTGQKEKTVESGATRFTGSPTRTIILIAIGLGIVILALIPIVVVTLLHRAEDTPTDLLRSAKMQTTILNRNLTDQLGNTSSTEYQTFVTAFISEIDKLYKNGTSVKGYYQGVVVDKIEETNSILVTFSVILLSDNNQIPSNEDLTQILKDTKDSTDPASETGKLGVFDIDIASIKVIVVITISDSENPLRTTTTSSTTITVPPTTETTNATTIESTSVEVTNASSPMTTQESTEGTTLTTDEVVNTTSATTKMTFTTQKEINTTTATTTEETNTTTAMTTEDMLNTTKASTTEEISTPAITPEEMLNTTTETTTEEINTTTLTTTEETNTTTATTTEEMPSTATTTTAEETNTTTATTAEEMPSTATTMTSVETSTTTATTTEEMLSTTTTTTAEETNTTTATTTEEMPSAATTTTAVETNTPTATASEEMPSTTTTTTTEQKNTTTITTTEEMLSTATARTTEETNTTTETTTEEIPSTTTTTTKTEETPSTAMTTTTEGKNTTTAKTTGKLSSTATASTTATTTEEMPNTTTVTTTEGTSITTTTEGTPKTTMASTAITTLEETINSTTAMTTDMMSNATTKETSSSPQMSTKTTITESSSTTHSISNATTQLSTKETTNTASTPVKTSFTTSITKEITITTTGPATGNLSKADMKVTVTNIEYTPELANSSSKEYKETVANFTAEIDSLYTNSNLSESYEGVVVDRIEEGSLIFFFALIFRTYFPSRDTLSAILEETKSPVDQSKGNLGQFVIDIHVITVVTIDIISEKDNPLKTTEMPTTTQSSLTPSTTPDTSDTTSTRNSITTLTASVKPSLTTADTTVSTPTTNQVTSPPTVSSTVESSPASSTESSTTDAMLPVVELDYVSDKLEIGEKETITCSARNIEDWSNIKIWRSRPGMEDDVIANLNPESLTDTSTQSSVTSSITMGTATTDFLNRVSIAPSRQITNNSADIVVEFNNVACGDDGVYHCAVSGNNFSQSASVDISAIKTPSAVLTFPWSVIEGQWLLDITCVVHVGYPPGNFTWRIKQDGEDNFENYVSYWAVEETNVTENCLTSYTYVLDDKMEPNGDYNNSLFQCAVVNTSVVADGIVESNTTKVQFISVSICDDKEVADKIQHPYDTNFFIACDSKGNPTVHRCSDYTPPPAVCYVTTTSSTVTTTQITTPATIPPGTPALVCPPEITLAVEESGFFTCEVLNASITDIQINRTSTLSGFEMLLDESGILNSEVNENVDDWFSVFTEQTMDRIKINFTFVSVECEDGGTYSVSLNSDALKDETEVLLSNPSGPPTLLLDSSVYENQETTAICSGNLGNPKGQMELQIKFVNSSSFNTIEEVQVTSEDDKCQNKATMTYDFYPTSDWDGATINCIIPGDGNDTSDQVMITLLEPVIQFQNDTYELLIGDFAQLICDVSSILSLESVEIYRNVDDGEKSAVMFVNGTMDSQIPGATVGSSSSVLQSSATFVLEFESLTCTDKGQYYCRARADATYITTTILNTRVKPTQKPTLTLSREIIENKITGTDRLHKCSGHVGYPDGELVIQSNKNNTFEDISVQLINIDRSIEGCSNFIEIDFATTFDMGWNNTDLRCVIRNSQTLNEDEEIASQTKTVLIVQENYCLSAGNKTYVYHPYNCNHYVVCGSNTLVGDCGSLCWGINTENACDHCWAVTCAVNKTESSSSTMPSTTSTAATTQDPSPYIDCSLQEEYTVNDSGTFTCRIYGINLTSVEINRTSVAGEEIIIAEGDIAMSTFSQTSPNFGHIVVESSIENKHMLIEVTFNPVGCEDDGMYHVSVNSAELEDSIPMSISVPVSKPSIQSSAQIYKNQITTVTCDGQLGYPEGEMKLQVQYPGETTFNTLTDNVIVDSTEDNCYNNATLTYTFYPTSVWNNSVVRCATVQGEIQATSDKILIELKESVIQFENDTYELLIGDFAQLICDVSSILSLESVEIYRNVDDGEKSAVMFVNGTMDSQIPGATVGSSSSVLQSSATFVLEFESLTCTDKGQYYCRARADATYITTTFLNTRVKPTQKPTLTLSREIIENKITGTDRLHKCSGHVGYPGGELVIQSNKNNTFEDISVQLINIDRSMEDCSNFIEIDFATTFDMGWNNTDLRCVIRNSKTMNEDEEIASQTKTVLIVQENYCLSAGNKTYVYHPYNCNHYVVCGSNTLVGDCGSLCWGINTENACDHCWAVTCAVNKTEPSSSTMPSTTPTAATTQDPSPYIDCSLEEEYTVNDSGTFTCRIYGINLTSVEINRTSVAGEEMIIAEGDIAMSTFSQTSPNFGHIVVESSMENKHMLIEVTFNPVGCKDDGMYHVSVNSAELEDSISMSITVPVSKPSIQTSAQIYKNQITTVTCDGQLGYPEGEMKLQVQYPGETTFNTLTDNVIVDSTEDNCYNNATLTYTFYPTSVWNNSVVRCATVQGEIQATSDKILIELKESVVYFANEEYTFYIGNVSIIECNVQTFASVVSVDIYRTVGSIEEKATLSMGNTKTSTIRGGTITDSSSISPTQAVVKLEFSSFECANKGQYFCRANGDSSQETTTVQVKAKRKPSVPPQLELGISLFENKVIYPECTGYVGYPDGGELVVQTNKNGTYEDLNVDPEAIPFEKNDDNCTIFHTLRFTYAFTSTFNDSDVRCIVRSDDELSGDDFLTSEETHILLISEDHCADVNTTVTPLLHHPYDCTKFVSCAGMTVFDCGSGGQCWGIGATFCDWCTSTDVVCASGKPTNSTDKIDYTRLYTCRNKCSRRLRCSSP